MKSHILSAIAILALPFASASAQEATALQQILHPEDAESLTNADAQIAAALKALPGDAFGLEEIPATEALLKKERGAYSPKEMLGDWKVRSIQGNNLGLFSYPYFNARVQNVGGMLIFEKTTGSQRRSGLLLPDGDHLVLVGGRSVNDDPQNPYSTLGGTREHDTVGAVFKIAPGEFLILLDTSPTRFEIYQLKRP